MRRRRLASPEDAGRGGTDSPGITLRGETVNIRISAVRCAAASAALGALVSLSACSASSSSPDPETTSSAAAPRDVLLEMLRVTDELSRLQGGAWEHEGGKPFDVNRTAGFRGALTCDDEVSRSFSTQILGPGVSDPEEATTAAAEHFASQGFKETNKF